MAYSLVLVYGLAVWRLTHMLWNENGPADVFARLRAYFATVQKKEGGIYDMISCFNCLSVWVSIPAALFLATNIVNFFVLVLALSAIAIFLNKLITLR